MMMTIVDLRYRLSDSGDDTGVLLARLSEADRDRETANERWSIRDHLVHLALPETRERLAASRSGTLALLDELTEADLILTARHASLRILTLAECFAIIVDHQALQLGEITEALGREGT
ncbi:MAG: DinB family protein [Chloroflexota bacterium]